MSSVDERIVEMRFDNQQFESGVSTSLRTLDKLKASLTGLGGSANNLSELQTQADNFDMSGISAGVDKITDRFSTFGIMADQVVRRVTNALINLGAQGVNAVKGLTIEPISTGFSQYEKETKSVQTLMNATGLGMEEVEKYTEKLGFYVDETSYSYESMFSTLASMMSSGVEDVDTGVAALIGLGNAAGLAGVDAAQATHAFEGFGKAIGQGYMDSRNWSWIKTARMDTTALKQAFIDAGIAEGTLVQEKDNKTGEMLTYIADAAGKAKTKLGAINAANMDTFFGEHWLSRDVMLKGVGNYSTAFEKIYEEYQKNGGTVDEIVERLGNDLDEYSLKAFKAANQTRTFTDVVEYIAGAAARRWSGAFKTIFGNFEDSSALWTSLIDPMYDLFITPLDDINDVLDEWHELGGYEDLTSGITESFESLASAVDTIRTAFHDIFPAVTAERLLEVSKGFKEFTSKFVDFVETTEDEDGNLIAVNETFGKLITGFKGGLSAISLVGRAFKTFFSSLSPTKELLKEFGSKMIDSFAKMGQFFIDLNNSEKITEFFSKASEKLVDVQIKLANAMQKVNTRFATFISAIKGDVVDGFKGLGAGFSLAWKGIKAIGNYLEPVGNALKSIGGNISDFFFSIGIDVASLFGGFGRFLSSLNECTDASEMFAKTQLKLSEVSSWVSEKFTAITDSIKGLYTSLKDFIKSNVTGKFSEFISNFKLGNLGKIIAGLGTALAGVNLYRAFDLIKWHIKGFTDLKYTIDDTLGSISDTFYAFGQSISAGALIKVAVAIGLLAGSLLLLGSIDSDSLSQGLTGITVLLAELYGVMALFTTKGKDDSIKDIFSNIKNGAFNMAKAATAMLGMAAAVLILASAVKKISSIDSADLNRSILAIGVLMGALTLSSVLLSRYSGQMAVGAAGMLGMAASVLILSFAVQKLSNINSGFEQGLIGTVALLGVMTGAGILMSRYAGKMALSAIGMIGMATGLLIMAGAIAALSAINADDPSNLTNSIVAIVILLAAIGALNQFGGSGFNMSAIGAAMLEISKALAIMTGVIAGLSLLDPGSMFIAIGAITALLAVIGAFNRLGGSGVKMIAVGASLLAISGAFVLMAGALAGISAIDPGALTNSVAAIALLVAIIGALNQFGGSGLNMIGMAAGILVMSAALTIMVPALLALGSAGMTVFVGILALAGVFAVLGAAALLLSPIAPMLLVLAGTLFLIGAAVLVAGAGFVMLGAGMASLAVSATAGAAGIVSALSILIAGIGVIAGSLVGAIAILVASIAGGLAMAVPAVVNAALTLVVGILNGLAAAGPAIVTAGIQLITGLINGIASQMGSLLSAGQSLIISFVNGLAMSINENGPKLIAAMGNVVKALQNTVISGLQAMVAGIPVIGDDLSAALEGLKAELDTSIMDTDLSSSGQTIGESVASGAEASTSNMESIGQQAGQSFASGVESTSGDATEAGANLSTSISDGLLEGFANIDASGAGSDLSSSALEGLVGNLGDFSAGGEDMSLEYITGLLNNEGGAQDAGNQLSTSGIAGADSTVGEWEGSGGNLALGLIKGILSKISDAKSAGAQLSTSAKEGADSAVVIASPSKAMIESGEYFGEGWIIGIKSMLTKAYRAGENLGGTSVNGISSAISDMSDLIENGIDTAPTITPVLDLSEVEAGMTRLRSMTDYSMNIGVPVGAVMPTEQSAISDKKIEEFLSLGRSILREIQNGSDLYFDDGVLAGRINRRLGTL